MAEIDAARATLAACGQEQLLRFADQLDDRQRAELIEDIRGIDWAALDAAIHSHVLRQPRTELPHEIAPPDLLPTQPADEATRRRYEQARRRGRELLEAGKIAAFVVAGGQGTRLGHDGPKGCLGVTPVRRKSLFQCFAEQLLAARRRYGRPVPWYIMTSPANDQATREFFAANECFGLGEQDVFFLKQGSLPAIGLDGKVLLAARHRLALSPNGHGGSLSALAASGALADMAARGVEVMSYFQVDNPLTKCLDPLFLGLHAEAGAEMSAKAVAKRDPMEKLGNFCVVDGKTTIIEYSDMPEELARSTEPDGRLRFRSGSTAIHAFERKFVEHLTAGGNCRLPLHRALKKVAHVDAAGRGVEPAEPNAIKLEMFVFDALPLARRTLLLETSRLEEFSPVKNAEGPDSIDTALHDQVRRAAAWCEEAGLAPPRDADGLVACAIEISPLFAANAQELAERREELAQVAFEAGKAVYLGE